MQDSLHCLPLEKWADLQKVLKEDFPRCKMAYYVLETQKIWLQNGVRYDFKAYCPYGDISSGMVAIIQKSGCDTIIMRCPNLDTEILEDALKKSKIVEGNKTLILAITYNILDCAIRISTDVSNVTPEVLSGFQFVLDTTAPTFDGVSLPSKIAFKLLSPGHASGVTSIWFHRYHQSTMYFETLIISKSRYGQMAWLFIHDTGAAGRTSLRA